MWRGVFHSLYQSRNDEMEVVIIFSALLNFCDLSLSLLSVFFPFEQTWKLSMRINI